MKKTTYGIFLCVVFLACAAKTFAHCQLPCGIYDDKMRFKMMREDLDTIELAMKTITSISKENNKDYNQLVRWVNNKELHANKIQTVASEYFLAQRVKPVAKEDKGYARYTQQVTLLHKIIIEAMKTKQTTDLKHVKNLSTLIDASERLFFSK